MAEATDTLDLHALSAPPAFTLSQDQTLLLYEPYLLPSTIQLLKCFGKPEGFAINGCRLPTQYSNRSPLSTTYLHAINTAHAINQLDPGACRNRVSGSLPSRAAQCVHVRSPRCDCVYHNVGKPVSLQVARSHWSIAKIENGGRSRTRWHEIPGPMR